MATKTITLELDAYEKLRKAKRSERESFSEVVRRARWEDAASTGPQILARLSDLRVRHPDSFLPDDVLAEVNRLGLSERVKFIGFVADHDLPALYRAAAVFAFPSLYEGFGLPVLESLACGTPVITTNVSSMPEIAGEAGLLVPPGDVAALENALEKLLSDPGERERRSRLGLEHARQFTWERTAQETYQVYRQVLGV